MQVEYITTEDERLEAICVVRYGVNPQAVNIVLKVNRSIALASYGPVLPGGLTIILPDLPKPVADDSYDLFD
jgi:phage tail protein X